MTKPFSDLQHLKRSRRLKQVNIMLPEHVTGWVASVSKKSKIPMQAIYASLLLAGIAQFEKDKPLERVS